MLNAHIFLVGMPGSGKTHWARLLGKHYNVDWIDLDRRIEQRTGERIAYIFETKGEDFFREQEQKVLYELVESSTHPVVFSCGGGTPCFHGNMQWMKARGMVFYLQTQAQTLIERLHKNFHHRPLLKEDLEGSIVKLLAIRASLYEQAHFIVSTEELELTNFTQKIESCTRQP